MPSVCSRQTTQRNPCDARPHPPTVESSDIERRLKQSILRLIERNTDRTTPARLTDEEAIDDWTQWTQNQFSDEWAALAPTPPADAAHVVQRLNEVDWQQGDPQRGSVLFEKRS